MPCRREVDHRPRRSGRRRALQPRGRAGDLLFCSGQVALDPADGELVGDTPAEQARAACENLQAVCEAAGHELADARALHRLPHRHGRVRRRQRGLRAVLRPTEPPARVAIGVAALPQGRAGRDRRGRRAATRLDGREAGTAADVDDIARRARARSRDVARRTPVAARRATLTERLGARRSCSRPRTCSAPARSRSAAR